MSHEPAHDTVDGEPVLEAERDMISSSSHPPYNIVTSCKTIGFFKPLDCFWSEITSNQTSEQVACACAEYRQIGSRWSSLRQSASILVNLHRCLFNHQEGSSIYRMGQCPACHTIYWGAENAAA